MLSLDWSDQKVVDEFIKRVANSTVKHVCYGSDYNVIVSTENSDHPAFSST